MKENDFIKVSVIAPMYNSANYLSTCVESFLSQTLDDCELLLVDDASPDNSYQIAKEYEALYPDRIRVLHYGENRRAGGARNYGLLNAKGKYVCFLDADDWISATMLEKCYKKAEKENCEIVDCDYYACKDENDSAPIYHVSMRESMTGVQTEEKRKQNIVNGGRCFSKIFLRTMLIDNRLFYPEKVRYEDNGIGPLMNCMASKIGKINEAMYYYRTGNQSSQMGNVVSAAAFFDRLNVGKYFLEQSKRLGLMDTCYQAVEYRFIELYYASNLQIYVRGNFGVNLETFKNMKKIVMREFPKYKTNKYIKKYMPLTYKISYVTNDCGICFFNLYKKIFLFLYRIYKNVRDRGSLPKKG